MARSGIMVYEENIFMLANLPLLRPVEFAHDIEVDMVKRKVLHYILYFGLVREERDLKTSPIGVRGFEF